jgi:Arc/MetJ-type ribon-helix-helix transcriptional regulator
MQSMRSVINISLPPKVAQKVKMRAKRFGFSSTSEYVRSLLDMDDNLISSEELLEMSRRADREYTTGKLIKAKSMADLLSRHSKTI